MPKTFVTLVVISAFITSWAQEAAHFTINHTVHFMPPTAQSSQFLATIPQAKDLLDDNAYQFAYEDLKGDGTRVIIIQGQGMIWCGSAGCLTLVLEKRGASYVTLLSENLGDDLAIMNEKVNGYAALKATFGSGITLQPKVFLIGDKSSASAQPPASHEDLKAAQPKPTVASSGVPSAKPSHETMSNGKTIPNTTYTKVAFVESTRYRVPFDPNPRSNTPGPRAIAVASSGITFTLDPGQGVVHQLHSDNADIVLTATGWPATHLHPIPAETQAGSSITEGNDHTVYSHPLSGPPININSDEHNQLWDIRYGADIAIDSKGNLFIADGTNGIKEIFAASGYSKIKRLTADNDRGTSYTAVAVDSKGNVFLGNNNDQIQELPASDDYQIIRTLGRYPFGNAINGLDVDKQGNVYFTIVNNRVIYEISAEDNYEKEYRLLGTAPACFGRIPCIQNARGVKVDSEGNTYFIEDTVTGLEVNVLLAKKNYTMEIVGGVTVAHPNGIALDAKGNIYLIDYEDKMIAEGTISIQGTP